MASQDKFATEIQKIKESYLKMTPQSRELNLKACKFLPDGDTRTSIHFAPYPIYMTRGESCYIIDIDGNRYFDYMNNFTSLIHGHGHPKIKEAVAKQLDFGTVLGAPHKSQYELAELLCYRVPSIEQIRFCNSGTEATMFAIRAARAFTGNNKVIKIEGGYHGSHETVETSVSPAMQDVGDVHSPNGVPNSKGIPKAVLENVLIAPFNNKQVIESIIEANERDLAAIILEPVMGAAGLIPADKEYLRFLRNISDRHGIVLIFDEIISFRLSQGGAQEWYGVAPDLTTLGKIIGGGFPIGAFGGRKEIMSLFSPKKSDLPHSGTFNAHPISMVAGLAALKELNPPDFSRINSLGDSLRRGIDNMFIELDIRAKTSGVGSLAFIHYTLDEIKNYRDARKAKEEAKVLTDLVHLCFLKHGIFFAARGQFAISTPMTDSHISQTISSISESFRELKFFIEDFFPNLIAI